MRVNIALTSLLLGVLLLSGCATMQPQFRVIVDSISGEKPDKNSYILLPGNKDTTAEDLQFKEYAAYVNRALIKQGFVPAESFEKANVAVFLVYGISDPQEHQYSYSIPIWGQTGVSSSYTTGTVSSSGGYSGTTTYIPTYGVTGSVTRTGSYTTYFRFMVLDAVDLDEYKKSKKAVQLWKTTVTSTGSSGDLRKVFPILVAASQQYIGKNTGQKVEVNLDEEDQRVIEIKGGGVPLAVENRVVLP